MSKNPRHEVRLPNGMRVTRSGPLEVNFTVPSGATITFDDAKSAHRAIARSWTVEDLLELFDLSDVGEQVDIKEPGGGR